MHHSLTRRRRMSEAARRRWARPGEKERQAERLKAFWAGLEPLRARVEPPAGQAASLKP